MGRRLAFDDVLGLIYDAALQPDRWPTALEMLGNFCGGTGSHLFLWDRRLNTCPFAATGGIPYDPRADHASRELDQDFLIAAGLRLVLAAEFLRDGSLSGLLRVLRDGRRAACGAAEAGRLQRLLPHLRRAVETHRIVAGLHAERGAMAAALHELATGVALLGADLRILWANRAAELMLGAADGLLVRCGRLSAATPADADRLRQLAGRATALSPRSGGEMLVSRASGSQPYVLLITPSPGRSGAGQRPTALLLITDPAARRPGLALRLSAVYGLTRAEARVAEAVLDGKRPEEIAEERAVSLATVRSQLHAVLAKTATTRQSELVRLLASLPVRHPAGHPVAWSLAREAHSHSIVPGGLEVMS